MKKVILLVGVLTASLTLQAQTDFVDMLSKEMDISTEQAQGGAGSLFNMAQEGMSSDDFGKLSEAVPDMSGLLGAVPDLSGGSKTSMLGKAASSLTGMPAVTSAFQKLGLNESHVAIMTPLVVNYVEDKGGAALSKTLAGALGM